MGRLSRIYIKTSDGNTWFIGPGRESDIGRHDYLGTSLVIRARRTAGAQESGQGYDAMVVSLNDDIYSAQFDARTLTISSPYFNSVWQDAAASLVSGIGTPKTVAKSSGVLNYIASINGVGTNNPTGMFFILGGMCVTPFISVNASSGNISQGDEDATGVMPRPTTNVLSLTDGCATCRTCDRLLQIKEKLEALKRVFWALKDVNLYKESIFNSRVSYVRSAMMDTPVGCTGIPSDERNSLFEIAMYNMLGQYMTVVHMWNYISQLGSQRVEILPVPEDISAFAVRVSSPKLTCDTATKIYCTVIVRPKQVQDGLTAWVPEPEIGFEPLHEYAASLSGTATQEGLVYTFSFEDSTPVVGTYTLLMRYYPYIPARAVDPRTDTTIDPSEYDADNYVKYAKKSPDGNGYDVIYEGSRIDIDIQDEPYDSQDPNWNPHDQADYLAARNIPAYNTTDTNIWEIEVTWGIYKAPASNTEEQAECLWVDELSDSSDDEPMGINKRRTDIYYYENPAVGQPMNNYTHDLTFHTPTLGRDPYMEIREDPEPENGMEPPNA